MRHTFKFGSRSNRRRALDEEVDAAKQGADPDDQPYLYDMSDGVEALLSRAAERYGNGKERAGPVTRLADMSPEKREELRRLYARTGRAA